MTAFNRVLVGDVRDQLATLPEGCVHCVVTSPPYWGLRDYGVAGQLGREATLAEYLQQQVDVFDRVRRVLRPDGVLWVNIGDTYGPDGNQQLIPFQFALAMQRAGWILRSTVIWHKRSPMPESLSGTRHVGGRLRRGSWRPTNAHEPVFMFARSKGYFADGDAASEPAVGNAPGNKTHKGVERYAAGDESMRTKAGLLHIGARERRNPRTVWSLSSEPFRGAHFAAYPTALVRRCVEASTSQAGCCAACGSQWAPVVESIREATRPGTNSKVNKADRGLAAGVTIRPDGNLIGNRDPQRHITRTSVLGYQPTCACPDPGPPVPAVVLDPYAGSGTTLQVAGQLGRQWIGIELNPDYLPLIEQRLRTRIRESS